MGVGVVGAGPSGAAYDQHVPVSAVHSDCVGLPFPQRPAMKIPTLVISGKVAALRRQWAGLAQSKPTLAR